MSEAPTPDAGPLSVDQAIAALTPEPVEEQAQEAPVEAAEGEETEGAASAPEEAEGEAEQPAEVEETEADPEPVVAADPPKYWSQDAKEAFGQLPPELQAVVLAQEGPREEATAKAKSEAAAEKQAAQAEIAKVGQLADYLGEFLPQAVETFKSKWGDAPDWKAIAAEHGTETMTLLKLEHDEGLALLQQTHQANEIAQRAKKEAYFAAEHAALAEIAPDLADPVEGPKRRAEVVTYLRQAGYDDGELEMMSARDMLMARKAKLWDDAQAALKTRPKPTAQNPAPAVRAPVRPAAAPAQPSPTRQARGRFDQAPTIENAVALLLTPKG
jgi:hypothetical protein